MGIIIVMVERIKIREGEINHLALGCVRGGAICLRFAEEGEDDLELFGGEEFALGGVVGGLKGGHQGAVGVDFTGEEFSCAFLAAVGKVGHGKGLF